ncbi:MAG: minichromosome maintenance protein MCM [Desulfurococcaceae archaeon]
MSEARTTPEVHMDYSMMFVNFVENFRTPDGYLKYHDRVWQMIKMGQRSLVVDFEDLILYNRDLADKLLDEPTRVLEAFSNALKYIVERDNPEYAKTVRKFYVRVRNPPKVHRIRELSSDYIGKFVAVEGIVTRITRVDAKLVRAMYRHVTEYGEVHYFMYPPKESGLEFTDRIDKPPYCLECHKPAKFDLVVEGSEFVDWQKVVIQEKPEEVPGGQIPRSIEAVLTSDIVDIVRPGDRVVVTGVLRVAPLTSQPDRRGAKTVFSFYIDVNHVEVQEKVLEEIVITREDEEKIRELARDPWIREKIIASIAPGIYGHWDIKEAIALAMFGGTPKILADGTRIRGDIHVLIIGDPGTAKSQLLQFSARVAPRGLYTSGKGSTAAGLTATVLRDKMTGEYYLEAGALVLADGGVASIDEIDKMRDEDRTAIHEALEQQTVSIAKAGIVARLNARTTVIAAGNPKYGRYDSTQPVSKNIDLPVTILSRFDLIFIVQDIPSEEQDRRLAKHILGIHTDAEKARGFIDPQLLKKYISYARRYIRPQLTPEAAKLVEEFYTSLRKASLTAEGGVSAIAITPRQLEAIIRLAEAHAKMALKTRATIEDVEEAIRLVMVSLSRAGLDVESGRLDIDLLETGISSSTRLKKKKFREWLMKLLDSVGGEIEFNELIKRAADEGFEKDFVQETVHELYRSGEVYYPRPGRISKVK